ncbi:BMP family ABC transporter substrate-binding protein [Herbidospora sp. NBRC 101105]|uniref:BMP family lipoprotein n=1 Tax=Herbidospora sp. NBRC 101105 TaxID=3032195 RepID=UPI0024A11CA6|nr:BMP family ABC transporter substrate-binding protein [Herbidospora sp. NBRC 101105]GLX95604.1 BMP family ABC transporter substrate-binding protein [Herbidospora sp. NBRC 101105]
MLRNRFGKVVAGAAAGAMLLAAAACGGGDTTEGAPSAAPADGASSAPAASGVKVGLAYDIGGRGDQSFNDSAAAGLDKAVAELGVEINELEAGNGEAESAKEERLRLLASGGFNPVIAVGFAYSASVAKVAAEFPDTKFAIVDDEANKLPNVSNLVFAEEQGSFLVGAAAALKSTKGNVGFVGGVEVPLIKKFQAGFEAGAKAVKPDIKIQAKYLTQPPDFSGFGDPAKGKTAAEGMFDAGADVVYQAAGGSGAGVFEAAKAAGGMAIGVDSDQAKTADPTVADVIITSMLKKVDVAVFDFIKSFTTNSVVAGSKVYDLKAGGVDYSTTGGKVDDIKTQLDEYKAKISSGEITVPKE